MGSAFFKTRLFRRLPTDPGAAAASPTAILRRQVLIPAALLLGTALLTIALLLIIAAIRENRIVLANETRTVTSLLDDLRSRLATTILDYSRWDDAVAHLTPEVDPAWADSNVGQYLHETFDVAITGVLSPAGRITYSALDQARGGESLVATAAQHLARQIAEVRNAPLEQSDAPTTYLNIDGTVYLFAVAAVTPENAAGDATGLARSVLLLGRRVDTNLLQEWRRRFVLPELRLVAAGSVPADGPVIGLFGPDDAAVGALTWVPERPGDDLLVQLLPSLIILSAILAHLGRRIATAWQKALSLVGSTERELSAIVEAAPDGIVLLDGTGKVRRLNPAAERIFGRLRTATIGDDARTLMVPAHLGRKETAVGDWLADHLASGPPYTVREVLGLRPDGAEVPLELSLSPVDTGGGRFFVAMVHDTTERALAERRLLEEVERAEAANRAKSAFLANMSHELRTPLNAIIGFAELIDQAVYGPLGHAKYQEYVRDIGLSGQHLLAVISQILDLSVVEAGRVRLAEDIVDPNVVLAEAARAMAVVAERALVSLTWRATPLPAIRGDRVRLRQILINLLSNAVKYSSADGRVEAWARSTMNGGVEFVVRDRGIGMSGETMARAFHPFARGGDGYTSGREGVGLGLPLSRELARLHGGDLWLESRAGEGTIAIFRLPPDRCAESPAADAATAVA